MVGDDNDLEKIVTGQCSSWQRISVTWESTINFAWENLGTLSEEMTLEPCL